MQAGSARASDLQQEIQEDSVGLLYMLDEVDRSIDAAEKNPKRFKLSQAEISERRKWVLSTRRQVESCSETFKNTESQRNMEINSTSYTNTTLGGDRKGPSTATQRLEDAVRDENNAFIRSEGQQQAQLMAQQDAELDVLSQHVVRIGDLGREMGQELESQGQLLDEFGGEMDVTGTRLAAAQKKVQYVLDKAGSKGQIMIIAVLVIALVILVFLAIA